MAKFISELLGVEDMSYDEARQQDVLTTGDDMFDRLDELFGIVPGTDRLIEQDEQDDRRGEHDSI